MSPASIESAAPRFALARLISGGFCAGCHRGSGGSPALCRVPLYALGVDHGGCSVLLGLALGSVQPMIMSTLHQITPEARHGEAIGLRLMSLNASSVVMPLLFGTAGAAVGVSVVFWTVGLAVGAGARSAWRLRPTDRKTSG